MLYNFLLMAFKIPFDKYYLWCDSESLILFSSLVLGTDLEELCITLAIASAVEVNSGLSWRTFTRLYQINLLNMKTSNSAKEKLIKLFIGNYLSSKLFLTDVSLLLGFEDFLLGAKKAKPQTKTMIIESSTRSGLDNTSRKI